MSDWSLAAGPHPILATSSLDAFGPATWACAAGAWALNAWTVNNQALFIPFVLARPLTVKRFMTWTGTVNGTLDVGVYDAAGTRLVSTGATAQSASAIQAWTLTATPLTPGAYYMAMLCTGNTQFVALALGTAAFLTAFGMRQVNVGSGTLPATATLAAVSGTYVPLCALQMETTWP